MEGVATVLALEIRLRPTIGTVVLPTATTGLRGVSRVNLLDTHPFPCRFVSHKAEQLGKGPGVEMPLGLPLLAFAATDLGGRPDMLQVLKHEGTARGSMVDQAFGEDVIVVTMLPKQLTRKLLQVPFGRLRAFLLELSAEAKEALLLLTPASLPEELTRGGHGRMGHAQVHTDHLRAGSNDGCRNRNDDMQPVAPFAVAQVGATRLGAGVLLKMCRNRKGQRHSTRDRCQATRVCVPAQPKRTLIVANGRHRALWTLDRFEPRKRLASHLGTRHLLRILPLLPGFPGERGSNGFSGFDAGSADQLCRQIGVLAAQRIVRAFVQLDAVATLGGKPFLRHDVEAGGVLSERAAQDRGLLGCRLEL